MVTAADALLQIRPFLEADTSAVIALWHDCSLTRPWNDPLKDIQRKLAVQRELFLVGEIDGRVMASAMAGYDGHRGSLYYFAVAPEYQGKGHGRRLMEEVERLLVERGCLKLNFPVRTGNAAVGEFYRSVGYTLDDVVSFGKRFIPDGPGEPL